MRRKKEIYKNWKKFNINHSWEEKDFRVSLYIRAEQEKIMIKYDQQDIKRFYSKIDIIENGPNKDCWNIDYARDKDGYWIALLCI